MIGKEKAAVQTAASSSDSETSVCLLKSPLRLHDNADEAGRQEGDVATVQARHAAIGNTGVPRTWPSGGGLRLGDVGVDYLAFSIPCESLQDIEDAISLVRSTFGELVEASHGTSHYAKTAHILGTGHVSWTPDDPRMNVHVDLGAQALGMLARQDNAVRDVRGFLKFLLEDVGVNFTRLDLCVDDHASVLDLAIIEDKIRAQELTSPWRSYNKLEDLANGGLTLYLGSRRSDSFMRFYDKRRERIAKTGQDVGHEWTRCELELKRDRARAAVEVLVQRGVASVPGIIRGELEFREPREDVNKSRWPASTWWRAFLGHCERLTLRAAAEVEAALESKMRWFEHSMASTFALWLEVRGGDLEAVLRLADRGRARRTAEQEALLVAWRRVALDVALEGGVV